MLVYSNDFNGPAGTTFPEWTSSAISFSSSGTPPGLGMLPAPTVATTVSPNRAQRFLGEFGGPPIGRAGDPGWNHTRVQQTISLGLSNLPKHNCLQLSFDLYVLKSWDGDSPTYGPDRFFLNITGGPTLLNTTFSNNPKVISDGSYQSYPGPGSLPRTGAFSTNTLGYNRFFCDSIYRFQYTFPHSAGTVTFNFGSSLFEGKGTNDESWGLDNVRVIAVTDPALAGAPGSKSQRGETR